MLSISHGAGMRKYPRGLQAMRRNRGFAFVIREMEVCCQENPTCEFSEECKALYDAHCDHWAGKGNDTKSEVKTVGV